MCWRHEVRVMIRTNEPYLRKLEIELPEWVRDDKIPTLSATSLANRDLHSKLLTLSEASTLLRISPRTLRRLVKSGQLSAIRIGRQLRFDRDILWSQINRLEARFE